MRPQCVPDTARAPVRCCTYASVEGQAQLWDLIDQCVFGIIVAVFGAVMCVTETHTPGGSCYGQRPYNEAQDVCDMQSARLCTSAEISAMSYLNNCGFLEEKVWTLDDRIVAEEIEYCPLNHHVTRAGSDTYLWKHPEECSELNETLANVMCCTGPIPIDPCLDVTCPISTNDCTSEASCISNGTNPGDYVCVEVDVSGFYSDIWTCGDTGTCTGQLGVCDASANPCETISCFQEVSTYSYCIGHPLYPQSYPLDVILEYYRASAGRLVFVRMAFAQALSRLKGLSVMAARASVQKESALQTATQAIRHQWHRVLGLLSLQVNHQPPCLSLLAHPNLP